LCCRHLPWLWSTYVIDTYVIGTFNSCRKLIHLGSRPAFLGPHARVVAKQGAKQLISFTLNANIKVAIYAIKVSEKISTHFYASLVQDSIICKSNDTQSFCFLQ